MKRFPAIDAENALPTLRAFMEFVQNDQVTIVGGPVRVVRTAQGQSIIFEPESNRFVGAFRVSTVGPRTFRVGEGTVNGEVPILDGRDLAGLMPDGDPHPEGAPSLRVEGEPETRRSWICLLVTEPPASSGGGDTVSSMSLGVVKGGDPPITIVHRIALPDKVPYGLDEEGRGLRPIAQLTWNEDRTRVDRVRQILHFDQEYRAPKGSDPRPEWRAAG